MLPFIANPRAFRWLLADWLRNLSTSIGPAVLPAARRICLAAGARTMALQILMFEHRLSGSDRLTGEVLEHLPQILERIEGLMGPSELDRVPHDRQFRAIVLKAPTVNDAVIGKGVLLIKFTETFRFFHHHVDVERLMEYFCVVLEPSWSGYCLPEILFWSRYRQPVIVQASEPKDRRFIGRLGRNLVPMSIGASDWVDHRVFRPLGLEKRYDVIYVANLSPIKRVHVYLRALSEIVARRGAVRAALVLSSWGGDKETFEQLLELYSVGAHLEVFMNLNQDQLNELLNRSRVSVLLSRKEGSNKTLFESMFADTPVILLRRNIGVNKDYINPHTGMIVEESELASAIEKGMATARTFSPREWAMAHIAPEIATRQLAALIERHCASGSVAPGALLVKVNSPEATYMYPLETHDMPNIADVLGCFYCVRTASESPQMTRARIRELFGLWNARNIQ